MGKGGRRGYPRQVIIEWLTRERHWEVEETGIKKLGEEVQGAKVCSNR